MKRLFDSQIDRMVALIDEQFLRLQSVSEHADSHIVELALTVLNTHLYCYSRIWSYLEALGALRM